MARNAPGSQEASCLDEPYTPREPAVIRAELRELAELHLAADLLWFRMMWPEVWKC